MELLEPEKRVTRSQHLLPDPQLSLSRSPLKDARIAQRNYHIHNPTQPLPDDPESDDEILLSPGKSRPPNSRANSAPKRSVSPPPQDEYSDATAQDGREFKRQKRDPEDGDTRDAEAATGGSDIENTNTNIRFTAAPSHTRNLSEPIFGSANRFSKPRSSPRRTPKTQGRARSVPVFPVLDLSNPPVTPWDRRARSRSPSKERETCSFQLPSVSSLPSIPDELVAPLLAPTTVTGHVPPVVVEPPSTPRTPFNFRPGLATPMSPLTPVPETPLPVQAHLFYGGTRQEEQRNEGLQPSSAVTSSIFPLMTPALPTVAEDPQIQETAEENKAIQPSAPSRLPRPSSVVGLPTVPGASKSNPPTKKGIKGSMAPPPVPSGSSTSTSNAPKNAFHLMMASSARGTVARGKGKGKEKEKMLLPAAPTVPAASSSTSVFAGSSKAFVSKEKGKGKEKAEEQPPQPKEEKKVSLKAKMRPREKPKPAPLPIHVRLPEESDTEPTSTPTAASRPQTPTVAAASVAPDLLKVEVEEMLLVPAIPVARRPSSPLTELDNGEEQNADPLVDDAGPAPPASSTPDVLYSPSAGPQLSLVNETAQPPLAESTTPEAGEKENRMDVGVDCPAELPVETPPQRDVAMEPVDERVVPAAADVSMSGDAGPEGPPVDNGPKGRPRSRAGKPRLPPALPAPVDRVTRSASLKRKDVEGGGPAQKRLFGIDTESGKPTKKQKMNPEASSHSQAGLSGSLTKIPPASPSKSSSFANPTKASAARATITKAPAKNKPVSAAAPSGSQSPTKNKLVRASSMFNARPPPSFARTFTGPDGNPSSLQTLASALEKLRMPPPERPNTSLGFTRDDTDSSLMTESTGSMDDGQMGMGRPSGGLQRASTVASIGSSSSSSSSILGSPSKSKLPSSSAVPRPKSALARRPLAAFMVPKAGSGSKLTVGTGSIMRGGSSLFGAAGRGRAAPKVSRNPGLPSVMGSPVKGGAAGDGDVTVLEEEGVMESAGASETIERVTSPRAVTFDISSILDLSKKGKEKEQLPGEWKRNASRRASLIGQDLSKSVSLPPKPLGLMGPPETPLDRMRSSSSSYPSSSSSDPSGSAGTDGMRRSTRIAKNVASATDASVGDEDDAASEAHLQPTTSTIQPLAILKGCTVFVDIVSELGDDSAKLFITDMLRNLGARVLASVGQTCTHIVYKNGQRSTYTRYKALPDPKPHVVGMEWVVKSAEKRNHEEELPYLIDMDDMNTTAMKRRKSMLPRLVDNWDEEQSFDGSSTSVILDDDLAPLERARLRKAAMMGT